MSNSKKLFNDACAIELYAGGLMKFHPIKPNSFPQNGLRGSSEYKNVRISHFLNRKKIKGIEKPQKSDHWVLRDNGSGSLNKNLKYLIFLHGKTRKKYKDKVL